MSGFLSAKSALSQVHHVEFSTRISFTPPPPEKDPKEERGFGVAVRSALCGCTNLQTHRGRRNNALLILTIAIIPVVALVIQNAVFVERSNVILQSTVKVKDDVLFSIQSGTVVHYMQIERGTSALYISSGGDASVLKNLENYRKDTDNAIDSLTLWVGTAADGESFVSGDVFHQAIRDFRLLVTNLTVTVPENVAFYSHFIAVMIGWLASSIQYSQNGQLWPVLVRYHMLIISKEQAGVERALGSTFFAQGKFTGPQLTSYLERKLLGESYLQRYQQYSVGQSNYIKENYDGTELQQTIERMRATIIENNQSEGDVQMGTWWFDNMTQYINILKKTQDSIAQDIVSGLELEIASQEEDLAVSVSIMTGAILLLFLVIISVSRLTRRLQQFAFTLQEKTVALNIERKRSQHLLNELLPSSVAKKLMANEPVEPESYEHVTIFFSDIVGFTSISSKSSPMQVIDMLNMLYATFDETLDLYNVYKVETIGDAYMIASGLPVRNEEGHAVEMAELALELRDIISHMTVPHMPDVYIKIRIGLNSGSVVAGVVGHKMPRYCLFGDTVNVASRMESSGLPLKIQCSPSTYHELVRRGGFFMEERGEVEIKGKGLMRTYFLEGQQNYRRRKTPNVNGHNLHVV